MSGMALSQETLDCVVVIMRELDMLSLDLATIPNKELRVRLYDQLDQIPAIAQEFLRLLLFKAMGNSLLIKSQSVIRHIRLLREYKKLDWTADLFQQFVNQNGIEPLAAEFLRYKKLWLAFKGDATVSRIINKARKYSERCKYVKNIGLLERITWDDSVKTDEVIAELSKVSFYKRVVLANCLLHRQNNPESALYINNSINRGEDFLGFLAANENGTKTFYFMNAGFGDSIVACDDEKGKNAIKAMTTQVTTVLKLKDVLNMAGATVVNELSEEVDVDLSLDKVTKDTFINLL